MSSGSGEMVKWRYCLLLAVLLLLPSRTGSKRDEEDEDERNEEEEEDEDNEEDYEEEDAGGDKSRQGLERRTPAVLLLQATRTVPVTRTTNKRPLECYVCAFKSDTPLRACLDPIKYRVHTMTCHSPDDKCFTSVTSKGSSYEAVVRGCRSACVGTPEVTCCESNHCNQQAFAMPTLVAQRAQLTRDNSKASKTLHPSVLFFVTILLVLQTVVKVAFV